MSATTGVACTTSPIDEVLTMKMCIRDSAGTTSLGALLRAKLDTQKE